jgi:hypothetical protein
MDAWTSIAVCIGLASTAWVCVSFFKHLFSYWAAVETEVVKQGGPHRGELPSPESPRSDTQPHTHPAPGTVRR